MTIHAYLKSIMSKASFFDERLKVSWKKVIERSVVVEGQKALLETAGFRIFKQRSRLDEANESTAMCFK